MYIDIIYNAYITYIIYRGVVERATEHSFCLWKSPPECINHCARAAATAVTYTAVLYGIRPRRIGRGHGDGRLIMGGATAVPRRTRNATAATGAYGQRCTRRVGAVRSVRRLLTAGRTAGGREEVVPVSVVGAAAWRAGGRGAPHHSLPPTTPRTSSIRPVNDIMMI